MDGDVGNRRRGEQLGLNKAGESNQALQRALEWVDLQFILTSKQ